MANTLYEFCIERDEFELLVQWDKEKNGACTPRNVSHDSHRNVWWRCAFGHQWEDEVCSRTLSGSACPHCTGRVSPSNAKTFASEYPRLIKQWHPTRNVGVLPEDMSSDSNRKVWWVCSKGHEWEAQIKTRVQDFDCPICREHKLLTNGADFAAAHPEIAAQWHPVKNGARTLQAVIDCPSEKVWWQCEKGHEWQATISSRTTVGNGCPVCAGKVVVHGINDLASANPEVAAQWHPSKNGALTPDQVTPFSNKKVWWICENGHEYNSVIAARVRRASGCPYCRNRRVLAGFNDLATVNPRVAEEWHPDLNGEVTPQMVTVGSRKKIWWRCLEGHVWRTAVYSRAGSQKSGCPVCAGKAKGSNQQCYVDIMAGNQKEK